MARLIVLLFALGILGCSPDGKPNSSESSSERRPLTNTTSASLPVASFTYTPKTIYAGEKVLFDASASRSADGEIIAYSWDFDGDGGVDATGAETSSILSYSGEYDVTLTVTDTNGAQGISTQKLVVTVKLLER